MLSVRLPKAWILTEMRQTLQNAPFQGPCPRPFIRGLVAKNVSHSATIMFSAAILR